MSKIIAGLHQPNFLPYLGFFDKMLKSDIFVIRDEVLFVEKDFHQRNKIRINSNDNQNNPQFKWLKVPVVNKMDFIKNIIIKKEAIREKMPWHKRILHDIKSSYEGAEHFSEFFPEVEKIFDNSDEKLISLNMKIINFLKNAFGIKTKVIMASELGLKPPHYEKSDASEDIINICKKINANTYLSGDGGKNYLNLEPFKKEGIELIFQEYKHPVYPQRYPKFLPYMSAIDALFCLGELPIPKQEEKVLLEKPPKA